MNKKLQKIIAVLCAGMLGISMLTGCSVFNIDLSSDTSDNSSQGSSQSPSESSAESTPAPDSSTQEESGSSESSEESSESTMEDTSSEHSDILPDISADDPDFAIIFSENPLDADYTMSVDIALHGIGNLQQYCWAYGFAAGTDQYVGLVNSPNNRGTSSREDSKKEFREKFKNAQKK